MKAFLRTYKKSKNIVEHYLDIQENDIEITIDVDCYVREVSKMKGISIGSYVRTEIPLTKVKNMLKVFSASDFPYPKKEMQFTIIKGNQDFEKYVYQNFSGIEEVYKLFDFANSKHHNKLQKKLQALSIIEDMQQMFPMPDDYNGTYRDYVKWMFKVETTTDYKVGSDKLELYSNFLTCLFK